MNNLIVLISLLLSSVNSGKTNLLTKEEWLVGENKNSIVKEITSTGTDLILNLESSSFCVGANGIQLTIENDGNLIFNSNVEEFPYNNKVRIPANSRIKITTTVFEMVNASISCMRLGNVLCKIQY